MDRKFYIDLAKSGLRMPIGADLVLKEKEDHEERLLNGKLLGEVVAETANRFKTPLAFPLMDLTVEKEWILSVLGVEKEAIPTYHFSKAPGEEETEKIKSELLSKITPRIKTNLDSIRYVKENTSLIPVGMAIGPFSFMTKMIADPITGVYMAGMGTPASEDEEVKLIESVLEIATDTIMKSIELQVKAGAKAICLCEPAANKVYISPIQMKEGSDIFDRYVMNFNKRIKRFLNDMGADLIFHDCGELLDEMVIKYNELDPAVMSFGCSRTLWEDAKLVSENTVLFGNLPTKKFYSDTDIPLSQVKELTRTLISKMKDTNHPFILGSECDVLFVPNSHKTIIEKINMMLTVDR